MCFLSREKKDVAPSDAGVAMGDRGWRMPPTGTGLRCRNR